MRTRQILAVLVILGFIGIARADETKPVAPVVKAPIVKVDAKAPVVVPTTVAAPTTPVVAKTEPVKTEAPKAGVPAVDPIKVVVPPTAPVVDPNDFFGILKQVVASAKTGKWALLVGFFIMMLTWFVNKLVKDKIPRVVLPWLAMGLSIIASVAFSLATGIGWFNAIISGVQNGLLAAGGWSAIGKYIPFLGQADAEPAKEPQA